MIKFKLFPIFNSGIHVSTVYQKGLLSILTASCCVLFFITFRNGLLFALNLSEYSIKKKSNATRSEVV